MQSPVVAIAVAAFDVVTSAAVLLPEEEMDLAVGVVTAAEEACAVTSPADSGVLAAVVSTVSSDYPLVLWPMPLEDSNG